MPDIKPISAPAGKAVRERKGKKTPETKPPAGGASLKDRVRKPQIPEHWHGVLFGPPKTGKTTAAARAPGSLLVSLEPEGDASDVLMSLPKGVQPDVVVPESWRDFLEVLAQLHTTDRDTWKHVAFDSVSWMIQLCAGKDILKVLESGKDPRRPFMKVGAAIGQAIQDIVALPMDTIITAQIRHDEPGEEEDMLYTEEGEHPVSPAVTPMIQSILGPAVAFTGRTYKQQGSVKGKTGLHTLYYVSFDDGERSPAGSRMALPSPIQDFDITKLPQRKAA